MEEQHPAGQPEPSPFQPVLAWFSKGNTVETSDELPTTTTSGASRR